jgi:hypothetical protein
MNGYVSRIREQGGGPFRQVLWIGFAHRRFEDPRNGVQFQFGFSKTRVEFNGIWIDGWPEAQKAKRAAQRQLISHLDQFQRLLKRLPPQYYLGLYDRRTAKKIQELSVSDVRNNTERLNLFTTRMADWGAHVAVAEDLSRTEAIEVGRGLPKHIVRTFTELLPIYSLMIMRSPSLRRKVRVVMSRGSVLSTSTIDESATWGMNQALAYEKQQGRRPQDVSATTRGYDIESKGKHEIRYIEVKSRKGVVPVTLTENEYKRAKKLRSDYYLYVMTGEGTGREIADPANACFLKERWIRVWEVTDWAARGKMIHFKPSVKGKVQALIDA